MLRLGAFLDGTHRQFFFLYNGRENTSSSELGPVALCLRAEMRLATPVLEGERNRETDRDCNVRR